MKMLNSIFQECTFLNQQVQSPSRALKLLVEAFFRPQILISEYMGNYRGL